MKEKQSFHPKERNLKPNPNAGSGGVGASGTAGHSHMSGGTAGQRSGASAHGHRSGASSAAISIDSSLSSTHQAGATTPTRTSPSLPSSPTLSNQGNNNGNSNANNGHHSNRKKNLYKTELCRSAEETGECPYGPKCQFAHSLAELRTIDRHPRYKTEMCKTFWDHGMCEHSCNEHAEPARRGQRSWQRPIANLHQHITHAKAEAKTNDCRCDALAKYYQNTKASLTNNYHK